MYRVAAFVMLFALNNVLRIGTVLFMFLPHLLEVLFNFYKVFNEMLPIASS